MTRRRADLWKLLAGLALLAIAAASVLFTPVPWLALVGAPIGLLMLLAAFLDRRHA